MQHGHNTLLLLIVVTADAPITTAITTTTVTHFLCNIAMKQILTVKHV